MNVLECVRVCETGLVCALIGGGEDVIYLRVATATTTAVSH